MRLTIMALMAATCIAATVPASAQTFQVGPGGIGVDVRSPAQRQRDLEREELRRERAVERRRGARDWDETGSVGRCREVTVRERNEYGERITRTRRECR
jgi:hypothetical protein